MSENTSSEEPSNASFDQILTINKSAIETTQQLLSCPCSLTEHSSLALSLIIGKIIALYQTTLRNDAPSRLSSPPSNTSSSNRLIRGTPITVGSYKMDAKDEQRMRMQLVSNELREAAALVEKYAER